MKEKTGQGSKEEGEINRLQHYCRNSMTREDSGKFLPACTLQSMPG